MILTPGGAAGSGTMILRHRHRSQVMVRGPVTGRAYVFSAAHPDQPVDARDVEGLQRSGQFLRA